MFAIILANAHGEAGEPFSGFGHVGLVRGDLSVEINEGNGEEDDIANDDEDEGDAAPLELEDATDTAVGLACGDGAHTAGVARQAGRVFSSRRGFVE